MRSLTTLFTVFLLSLSGVVAAQVNWMTWDEAMAASEKEPKKIFVDVYTDWCGWCKRMDETTFGDVAISAFLNEEFYAVKFNAEQREKLTYKGKSYEFREGGKRGVHGLAVELLGGRLGYPSVVFLDESASVIQAVPGYHEAPAFAKMLSYFSTGAYQTTPWEEYDGK